MIIEYEDIYEEDVKNLLVELQEHIKNLDQEGYNILTKDYRNLYFQKMMEDVRKWEGKILLYKEQDKILGLVAGVINNEEINTYDFKAPKRGRITELVVSKDSRSNGIGSSLLQAMEWYLDSVGCKDVLLGVFGYNSSAISFYKRNHYHVRMVDMIKNIS